MKGTRFLVIAGGVAVLVACSGKRESSTVERAALTPAQIGAPQGLLQPSRLTLVDSSDLGEPGDLAMPLYRVEVTTRGRTDTIPGVWTRELPAVGPDGEVYAFSHDRESHWIDKAYRYDPVTRRLSELELPPRIEFLVTQLALSPDARHIAYFSMDSLTSYSIGLVRTWPDGKLIVQTPADPGSDLEVETDAARWLDANHAEFVHQRRPEVDPVTKTTRYRWIHAIVTVDARTTKVDTLDAKPAWQH